MSLTIQETSAKSAKTRTRRLGGVDAARAVAVLGMVMVHFGPNPAPETLSGDLYGVSHGRASILFVLLAGVGLALLAGRGDGPRWSVRGRLLFRAALLLPLGLWLEGLEHDVAVILQFYALYFVLAALVLTLPDLPLLVLGVLVLVGGPVLYLTVEAAHPSWFDLYPAALGDPLGRISRDLLISGSYPLAVWSAPLLIGIWLGRRNLHSPTVCWQLLVIGFAVAVAAPFLSDWLASAVGQTSGGPNFDRLATSEPHEQMPLWMAGSIGSACAVLGAALLVVDRLPRATWPLVATGQLALSVYVGHILLLTTYPDLLIREEVLAATVTVGVFMLLAATVCTLWRAGLPRGPLEGAFAAPGWATRRIVRLGADRARGTL
jgi:hypothetical protein